MVQVAFMCGCKTATILKAARRLGFVDGAAGVAMRRSASLDGRSRRQVHFDDVAALRIALDQGAVWLLSAVVDLKRLPGCLPSGGRKALAYEDRVVEVALDK